MIDISYFEGFKYSLEVCKKMFGEELGSWHKLGIFSHEDDIILETEKSCIAPENFLTAIATHAREKKVPSILLLNARRDFQYNLLNFEVFKTFNKLTDKYEIPVFYFGTNISNTEHFADIKTIKIDFNWLSENKEFTAKIIEDACPVSRQVEADDVKVENLESFNKFLVDKLGPPSLTEDLKSQIKQAEKEKVAADAISLLTAFVNPSVAVSRGIKYLSKFLGLVKKRRAKEMQEYLENWENNVKEGYSVDNLQKLIDEKAIEEFKEIFKEKNTCIIISDAFNTMHEFFIPIMLKNLLSEFEQESYTVLYILDNIPGISKFKTAKEEILGINNELENFRLAGYIPTAKLTFNEESFELVRTFLKEKAIIFDISPEFFEKIHAGAPYSLKAFLIRKFEGLSVLKTKGTLGFLEFDATRTPNWRLETAKPSKLISKLRNIVKKIKRD